MINFMKSMFRHPSAEELKLQQLEQAQRELVQYEAAVEYDTAMRDMLKARVARLTHN